MASNTGLLCHQYAANYTVYNALQDLYIFLIFLLQCKQEYFIGS